MSNPNGYAWNINQSTQIDLVSGVVTFVPIYLQSGISGTLTITLANCAPGPLVQVVIFNQSGSPVVLKFAAVDSSGNPISCILSVSGSIIFFSKNTVTLPAGQIRSAIGSMTYDPEQFILSLI